MPGVMSLSVATQHTQPHVSGVQSAPQGTHKAIDGALGSASHGTGESGYSLPGGGTVPLPVQQPGLGRVVPIHDLRSSLRGATWETGSRGRVATLPRSSVLCTLPPEPF